MDVVWTRLELGKKGVSLYIALKRHLKAVIFERCCLDETETKYREEEVLSLFHIAWKRDLNFSHI